MITTGLLDLHSAIRYLIVLLLTGSVATAFYGLASRQRYSEGIRKLHLATRILLNLQMLIGLLLYIFKGYYSMWTQLASLPEMTIFFTAVHIIGMIIGIGLVNAGYHKAIEAQTDFAQYKYIAIFYSAGFLVIFLMIPWPFFHSWANWF